MKKRFTPWLFASVSLFAALNVAQAAIPIANVDGHQAVKDWTNQLISQGAQAFTASGLQRQASPGFWGAEIVYQIQTDRFNNGDLSNDNSNIQGYQADNQYTDNQYGVHSYRHGGDLKGIMNRLDYLKDLGITSLWITPIFKHDGSYHGYCTADFSQIDPGFGTNEEFRDLVAQAHQRGMKVILDVVINHMCDPNTYYSQQPDHYGCANDLNANNWSGTGGGSSRQGQLAFSGNFFGPLRSQYFFNRCGANSQADMEGTGPAAIYGDFVSTMFDFDTRNHDFQEIFTNLHKYWIAYADVDGFRMDAAKHVTEDFIAYFSTQTRAYAKSLGKNNFYVVGEVAGPAEWIGHRLGRMYSNPLNPNQHGTIPATLTARIWDLKSTYLDHGLFNMPGLNGAYDFAHGGTARDVLQNVRSFSALEGHFYSDYYNIMASQSDSRLNLNLLEIHDWPRFANLSKHNEWKSRLGLSYLATAEGIPVIYYGMEQGFNGDCHYNNINVGAALSEIQGICGGHDHALYRQDMFISGKWRLGSTVASVDSLAYIGKANASVWDDWTTDPYLQRDHQVYKIARKLNYARRSCDALRYGYTEYHYASTATSGLAVFSRVDGNKEAVVVVNSSSGNISLGSYDVHETRGGIQYRNLLNGTQTATTGSDGKLYFNGMVAQGNSVMIFVPASNVGDWNSYLEVHQCLDNPIPVLPPEQNQAPVAQAGNDVQVNVGDTVQFDATLSYDPDGEIVSYQWSNGLEGQAPSQVYTVPGVYTVTLTVTDDQGVSAQDDVVITVIDPFPCGSAQMSLQDQFGNLIALECDSAAHTWVASDLALDAGDYQFVDNNGVIFGDTQLDGTAEQEGQAISLEQGSYNLSFNRSTGAYQFDAIAQSTWQRTVIFIYGQTQSGQDMFIRGGIDHNYANSVLGRNCQTSNFECAIPIRHNNWLNATTAPWKANDFYLDWYGAEAAQSAQSQGTALDWTTNSWPASWGTKRTVAVDGFGETPLNTYGAHYWMLDVEMDCSKTVNGWFELKSYISNGPGWEANVSQANRPYVSGNHFAQCGKINVFQRGSSSYQIKDF